MIRLFESVLRGQGKGNLRFIAAEPAIAEELLKRQSQLTSITMPKREHFALYTNPVSTRKCYLRNPKRNLLDRKPTSIASNNFDPHRAARVSASEARRLTSADEHGATHTVAVVHVGQILIQLHLRRLISAGVTDRQGIINGPQGRFCPMANSVDIRIQACSR